MSYTFQMYRNFVDEFSKNHEGLNPHDFPKIKSISLSVCEGKDASEKKIFNDLFTQLKLVSGQFPIKTIAKTSQASFKIRSGMTLGVKVTLRKKKLYDFLDRFIYIALPRMKNFDGFSEKSFSSPSSVSFGVDTMHIFPEIDYTFQRLRSGVNISIAFDSKKREDSLLLLKSINIPFKN